MSPENQRHFLSFQKNLLILMVFGAKIFFVEDDYGVKRFKHFQALFIAQTIEVPDHIKAHKLCQLECK